MNAAETRDLFERIVPLAGPLVTGLVTALVIGLLNKRLLREQAKIQSRAQACSVPGKRRLEAYQQVLCYMHDLVEIPPEEQKDTIFDAIRWLSKNSLTLDPESAALFTQVLNLADSVAQRIAQFDDSGNCCKFFGDARRIIEENARKSPEELLQAGHMRVPSGRELSRMIKYGRRSERK